MNMQLECPILGFVSSWDSPYLDRCHPVTCTLKGGMEGGVPSHSLWWGMVPRHGPR